MSQKLERRRFLWGAGLSVAGLAGATRSASSQTQGGPALAERAGAGLEVIDFHSHYVGPHFASRAGAAAPPAQRAHWQEVNRKLADPGALQASIDEAGVTGRVLSTPLEFIRDAGGELAPDAVPRINDHLAELVSRNPGRLYGLATVDAFSGDAGARELTRAVRELGLRGVFVESAKGELFLDSPQARPTLATAASLGIPVFVHPVTDSQLRQRLGRFGRAGMTLNRGTMNSAALIALLESGTFEELPGLRVVITTLAIGALLLTGGFGDGGRLRRDAPDTMRRHIYIDTMGLHPVLIRSAIELLGPDHVLAGTDWPVFDEKSVAVRLHGALVACGLDQREQRMVAGGNALRLLGAKA